MALVPGNLCSFRKNWAAERPPNTFIIANPFFYVNGKYVHFNQFLYILQFTIVHFVQFSILHFAFFRVTL